MPQLACIVIAVVALAGNGYLIRFAIRRKKSSLFPHLAISTIASTYLLISHL